MNATSERITVAPAGKASTPYGPVEVEWLPDRLRITAVGAGRVTVTEQHEFGLGEDVVIELAPPTLDDLVETVPGAD
jgi:hypothetical protein